jgi:hypothetical protein
MKTRIPSSRVRLPRMSPEESAEYRTRQDAVIAAGMVQINREQEELIRRGILDTQGNLIEPFVAPVGQSGECNEST